jgi:hypothetical protein
MTARRLPKTGVFHVKRQAADGLLTADFALDKTAAAFGERNGWPL